MKWVEALYLLAVASLFGKWNGEMLILPYKMWSLELSLVDLQKFTQTLSVLGSESSVMTENQDHYYVRSVIWNYVNRSLPLDCYLLHSIVLSEDDRWRFSKCFNVEI